MTRATSTPTAFVTAAPTSYETCGDGLMMSLTGSAPIAA